MTTELIITMFLKIISPFSYLLFSDIIIQKEMKKHLCSMLCALCFAPFAAQAVDFPSPGLLSNYGQIQNVQSYSSNPFNHPDSPYNQRMPVPVYVQGTELTAADCKPVVAGLVAQQCAMMNNCAGKRVSDIRPAIMVQLSNIP